MSIVLNSNVTSLKESSTLWINQKAKALRAQGKTVYHFGFGQSPFPVHPSIVDALKNHADEKDYLPTLGLPELREKICSYYKEKFNYDFSVDRIFIGPGSKEMIFQILFLLEGPVLVPAPSWVSYGPQVSLRGKKIYPVQTKKQNNYKLTGNELETICKNLDQGQKVLILNSPNNPTGAVYSDEDIKSIVEVCRKHQIIVISDEIYAQVDFTGEKKKGFPYFYPEGVIVSAGLSKSHSAGGYRLGFIALPHDMDTVIKAISSMVSETFSAVSAPIQYSALAAYDKDNDDLQNYINLCSQIHGCAAKYLHRRFTAMKVGSSTPEGAFYMFIDFENFRDKLKAKGLKTSKQVCEKLLQDAGIAVLPGCDFYFTPESLTARVATVDYDGALLVEKAQSEKLDDAFIEKHAPNLKAGMDALEDWLARL